MTNELSGNLLPLIEYTSDQGVAAEINALPRDWDKSEVVKPYSAYFRAAILTPMDTQLYESVAADFDAIDPDLRYDILAASLKGMDDEMVVQNQGKILRLTGTPDAQIESTSGQESEWGLRSQIDRAVVFDRLQSLGLVSGFSFDQDYFLEKIIDPVNRFEVSFDELLGLEGSYSSEKKSKQELIEAYNQWAYDPEGGNKVLHEDGIDYRQRDFAMGFESGRRKGEAVADTEAIKKIDNYLATSSHDNIVSFVEGLLFDRSPAGLKAVEYLSDKGLRGLLFEGSEQLPRAYGLALAAAGRLEEAQEVATGPRTLYEDYAYINLEIARTQRKNGDVEAAVTALDNLREIDPLLHFADRVNPDDYIGMMGGSPLGFMNESIAEEYAHCKTFDKALEAYRHSRQYPDQTEPAMANIAVKLDAASEYFSAILAFDATEHENVFMISRLSVALLEKLNSKLELGEAFSDRYPDIAAQVPELTSRLVEIRSQKDDDQLSANVIERTLMDIYTDTGNHDEALAILSRQEITSILPMEAFGKILTDIAYRGQYERAIELYDQHADYYKWVLDVKIPQFNIAAMGWSLVHGRRDSFDRFYNLLPDYKRSRALQSMLQKFKGKDLHIDNELAALIMKSEYRSDMMANGVAAIGRLMLGGSAVTASHDHMLR